VSAAVQMAPLQGVALAATLAGTDMGTAATLNNAITGIDMTEARDLPSPRARPGSSLPLRPFPIFYRPVRP